MDALSHFSLRASAGRPGRTMLTILSVVFGVMTVVAVANASRTTRLAYKAMFGAVTGNAALEVSRAGEEGFPESLQAEIEGLKDEHNKPLVTTAAPLVYSGVLLRMSGVGIKMQVLGVDPSRDRAVRDVRVVQGRDLAADDEMHIDANFAKSRNVSIGDEVKLAGSRSGLLKFQVVGLVEPRSGAAFRLGGMVFVTLKAAQRTFGKEDKLDRLQLVLPEGADPKFVRSKIEPLLPEGVNVDAPQDFSSVMKETSLSSEEGIKLSQYFTLLLAIFIITNTFLMNLGERRAQLAVIRAIGGTRWQIVWMMVREGLILALVGTLIGIGCGYLLSMLLHYGLERLYQVSLPSLPASIEPILLGFFFGMTTVLVAVIIPAYLSTLVTPLEGMRNVPRSSTNRSTPWLFAIGILVNLSAFAIVLLAIVGKISIDYASPAGVAMIFGGVLLCPALMRPMAYLISSVLRCFSRLESDMAMRQLLRHHLRTSLTMGVLFVAASTGIGMSSSILDCIHDVKKWRQVAVQGDFFVRATKPDMADNLYPDLPDSMLGEIQKVPGIKTIDTAVNIQVKTGDQTPIAIAREYTGKQEAPFDLVEGDSETLLARLKAGDVVIGTVLAQRSNYKLNEMLPMQSVNGPVQLRIAGVANDYIAGGMTVHMHRATAIKYLGVSGYDAFVINAEPGKIGAVQKALEVLCQTPENGAIVQSQADLSAMIDGMILVIDACMWGMVVLGYIVASFGVVNTLTMNVLEQTREIGLLRITGMTRKQVRRTIVMQALILGGIGITPGVIAGLGSSWLINLAMMPSLGHPVKLHLHVSVIAISWIGAMVIVLFAALLPALRASRISVVEALHCE